ncbi:MAG: ATP-dependent zinc metalloprotease FtsH [Acutalibacteraceae bacterium]
MVKNQKWKAFLPYIVIPLLLILLISYYTVSEKAIKKVMYYEIVELFDENKVAEYELNIGSGILRYKLKENPNTVYKYTIPNVSMFIEDVHNKVIKYNQEHPYDPVKADYLRGEARSWWVSMLPIMLIVGAASIFTFYMIKKMGNSISSENNRAISFGKARVKYGKDEKRKTTFNEVAGADEEKEELSEIVEFLKEPSRFNELGARIPKGVLLVGPPGTGKTLLARAVAGEADVPFFSISGSDFVEMYVGVGASRVRDLFDQAKKNSPSIIFIDEIDAVGRHRGAGMGGGHDEREQTLNQLLVEMDGFDKNEGVIIIAATNRHDILDPALLRPGRFDRQVTVGYPDLKGREEILKVHARGKPLAPDVVLKEIARSTVGFTGADLENLLNEAALLSAKRKKRAITMAEIEEATIKVLIGAEKKSRKHIKEKDIKITGYHEAGHAVVSYYQTTQDKVQQISIIPRGMAGGYTLHRPDEDLTYTTKRYMIENIIVLLGGRVAEELILSDISSGASNDIERATDIARRMVTRYGMSEVLGPVSLGKTNDEVFLGKDYSHIRNFSETVASQIDAEVKRIVSECYEECKKTLNENMDKLNAVAEYLFKKEKIDGPEFYAIMEGKNPEQAREEENAAENEKDTEPGVVIAPEIKEENKTGE